MRYEKIIGKNFGSQNQKSNKRKIIKLRACLPPKFGGIAEALPGQHLMGN